MVWLLLVVAAILNGFLRQFYLKAEFSDTVSHFLSTDILLIVIGMVIYFFLRKFKDQYSKRDLIIIGIIFFSFTILFEFILGHFVVGHSWQELLADYNLFNGRIWVLILLGNLTLPYLIGKRFLS